MKRGLNFPKNWKNFRDGFEASFLTKKLHLGSAGIQVSAGGRDHLLLIINQFKKYKNGTKKIKDEVDLEIIDDEYTLFIYLENNIAKKSIEEKINDFELIAYEDDILEQIKNYKND